MEEKEEKKAGLLDGVKAFGNKAIEKGKGLVDYVKENPEEAFANGCTAAGALFLAFVGISGVKAVKDAEKTAYDDETGETVRLRRKLTNDDIVELDQKMSSGKSKIEALNDMRLIK